ncbi:universal stress protein [Aquibium sp. A9E412]|uniref:universal stress protein n=1 Tax=Aquibium sp. A9E412 TaxID=2976767 RepID=UPI0025AF676F|nr:universal stress protein [Aquibium sp. A9E412]MDN2566675.1 universal stress protein [Aquibium sp. A9E412]
MPFKSLLCVLGVDQSDRDLDLALELAREADAHLSVLIVALAPPPPGGEYAAVASDVWMQERDNDRAALDARMAAVSERLAGFDVSSDVDSAYPEKSQADDVVGRRARYADLIVIGPELATRPNLKTATVNAGLFESGRPVLLVPEGKRATLKPATVLVAWDSGVEAARAVREALDLMAGATDVRVTMVDPAGDAPEPGADLAAYLARHGASVAVDRLPSCGHTVAEVLTQHAGDLSADLVVMGGYGHSRLRERVFGGVTRSMVEAPAVPVLMAR